MVKLLSRRWWIHIGARLEGQKLEPEWPRAEVGFPTADQGFSSIQRTPFGFYGIKKCLMLGFYLAERWIYNKKVPDVYCEVQDLLLEVVDLK